MEESFFTVGQAAILLKVHPLTIRRYIKEGKLKAVRLGGNVRIPQSAIEGFGQDIFPTSYGVKKVLKQPLKRFEISDPIFRLKGRGLSLHSQF